jgi:hypothetical protein
LRPLWPSPQACDASRLFALDTRLLLRGDEEVREACRASEGGGMTSTDLELRERPQTVALSNEQLKFISGTEFVPPGLRGNLPAILACVATGRDLGIGDMAALKAIHIVDGKATFSAELMVQLVRRAGHSIVGEVSDGSATVTGVRADNGDTMKSTWTLAMAERAGLLKKQNWVKYPEAMLWARAVSQLCRMLFADCFAGGTYTPEELDGEVSAGEPRMATPIPAAPRGKRPSAAGSSQLADLPGSTFEDVFEAKEPHVGVTAQQKKKLNVLVGTLCEKGLVHTEHLYQAVASMRDTDPDIWIAGAIELSDDGELHYGPLRDSLSKEEASSLIDRLSRFEATTAAVHEETQ